MNGHYLSNSILANTGMELAMVAVHVHMIEGITHCNVHIIYVYCFILLYN